MNPGIERKLIELETIRKDVSDLLAAAGNFVVLNGDPTRPFPSPELREACEALIDAALNDNAAIVKRLIFLRRMDDAKAAKRSSRIRDGTGG